eukprot:3031160-Pyramimonas_sp.AAC.1
MLSAIRYVQLAARSPAPSPSPPSPRHVGHPLRCVQRQAPRSAPGAAFSVERCAQRRAPCPAPNA